MEAEQRGATQVRGRQFARVLAELAIVTTVGVAFVPAAAAGHDRPPPSGTLDPRFGASGQVLTELGLGRASGSGVVLEKDGRIVVGGSTGGPTPESALALVAYRRDGMLDPTFGTGGIVITQFPSMTSALAAALVADREGRLVQLAVLVDPLHGAATFALVRYRRDGTLDPEFGAGGIVISDFGGQDKAATSLAIQQDGRIVVAGGVFMPSSANGANAALARFEPDGTLDTSFGLGGRALTDLGRSFKQQFHTVAIQHDGKIVAAGQVTAAVGLSFVVARYDRDGTIDTTFGSGGIVSTSFADQGAANGIAVQRDGKILVVGGRVGEGGEPGFALARLDSSGALDPTFGSGGQVVTLFPGGGAAGAVAVALDRCGRAVLAGGAGTGVDGHTVFALARYEHDGSLDPSFGTDGLVTTGFGGFQDGAGALAIQRDGKIVAAGSSDLFNGDSRIAVARYQGEEWCGCD